MALDREQDRALGTVPVSAGIGLRPEHYREILDNRPKLGWFEVHSENYFGKGGAPWYYLEQIRQDYAVSIHGVGLSLGAVDQLDRKHLKQLKDLIGRIEPCLVSEHLSWNSFEGRYLNDLMPLPYTQEVLDHTVERVSRVQDVLGRRILIENPSSYLEFEGSVYRESEFLSQLAFRSGCALLLDVNNVFVSCQNHGWNAMQYLRDLSGNQVEEIHLAGHTVNRWGEGTILIDTHNRPVCEDVWQLFAATLGRIGPKPTMIEWDTDIPELEVLLQEAARAETYLEVLDEQAA